MTAENGFLGFRSIVETPILDERKWGKVPDLACDAVIVDLEDSVPTDRKLEARERAVEFLGRPDYFRGKSVLARANPLDTSWGEDDLAALARAGVEYVLTPKVETPDDVRDVQRVLRDHGADPQVFAIIETVRAYLGVEAIAAVDGVGAIGLGTGDISVETGMTVYAADGTLNPAFVYPVTKTSFVAHALGLACFGSVWSTDVRDLACIRTGAEQYRDSGYTGLVTFYPPHLEVINEVFAPSAAQIARAEEVVAAYEQALARGAAATMLADGSALTVLDYKKATALLARTR